MLRKTKIIASSIITPVTLLLTNKVLAAAPGDIIHNPGGGFATDIPTFVNRILSYVLGIAAVIALFYFIMGGFKYLTSAGKSEAVQDATKMITYAIIGIVVIAISFALKSYIFGTILGVINP